MTTSILLFILTQIIDFISNQFGNQSLIFCSYIQPEQIISLTLSDGNDTPGLSMLFLSHFRLEQFTRLRSLTLIDIEYNSLKLIFSDLHKLVQLRAFSLNEESIRYPHLQLCSGSFSFIGTSIDKLPLLNRLQLQYVPTVASLSLSNLQHLKVARCLSSELKMIFQHFSRLRSLSTCLYLREQDLDIPIPPNQLIKLALQITRKYEMRRKTVLYLCDF